jgi:hypothetical protein
MKKHSELSASGSERWLNCPASVKLSREVEPLPDSKAALEGTKAHDLLEMWLNHYLRVGAKNILIKGYPADMIEAVKKAVSFIVKRSHQKELIPEEKISLEFIHPSMFGTADVQIVEHFGELEVWDYKHGVGKVVDIVDKSGEINSQLAYYALGVAHKFDFDFEKITIGVIQPRAKFYKSSKHGEEYHDESGFIRSKTLTPKELKRWVDKFKRGVDAVHSKDPDINPGSWCWFCPAKKICPEYVDQRASTMFDDNEAFFDDYAAMFDDNLGF